MHERAWGMVLWVGCESYWEGIALYVSWSKELLSTLTCPLCMYVVVRNKHLLDRQMDRSCTCILNEMWTSKYRHKFSSNGQTCSKQLRRSQPLTTYIILKEMATCVSSATAYWPTLVNDLNFGTAERCYNKISSGRDICLFYIPDRVRVFSQSSDIKDPKSSWELTFSFMRCPILRRTPTLTSSACCAVKQSITNFNMSGSKTARKSLCLTSMTTTVTAYWLSQLRWVSSPWLVPSWSIDQGSTPLHP